MHLISLVMLRNRASRFAAAFQTIVRANHPHAAFPVSGVTFEAHGDGAKFYVDAFTSVGLCASRRPDVVSASSSLAPVFHRAIDVAGITTPSLVMGRTVALRVLVC